MSDVEKYGLVAVVFVGGLLLLIAVQGGFGGDAQAQVVSPVVLDAGPSVGLDEPALKPAAQGRRLSPADSAPPVAGPRNVHVKSLLPAGERFDWNGAPVTYPGRRSASPAVSDGAANDTSPAAAATSQVAASTTATSYTVKAGDTLSGIAQKLLGTTRRTQELFEANRDTLKSLDDLRVGQVLVMPGTTRPTARQTRAAHLAAANPTPKSAQPSSAAASDRTYVVQAGDTLGEISQTYLGTARRAQDIYNANKDVLASPDALIVGQVLRIP